MGYAILHEQQLTHKCNLLGGERGEGRGGKGGGGEGSVRTVSS